MKTVIAGAVAGILTAVLVGMYFAIGDNPGATILPLAAAFAVAGIVIGWSSRYITSSIGIIGLSAVVGIIALEAPTFRSGLDIQKAMIGAFMGLVIGLVVAVTNRSARTQAHV